MPSQYDNPFSGNVKAMKPKIDLEARRLPVHAETAKTNMDPINRTRKNPGFGKLGIPGDGQQK